MLWDTGKRTGNGTDFFSRDAKGHRSECVVVAPPKIVNRAKGASSKRQVILISTPTFLTTLIPEE